MRVMGGDRCGAAAGPSAAQQRRAVQLPPDTISTTSRVGRARGGRVLIPGRATGRIRDVRGANATPSARSGQAKRPDRRVLRRDLRRRRLSHRRHRRDPPDSPRAARGSTTRWASTGLGPARGQLGQCLLRAGACRSASAAGVRGPDHVLHDIPPVQRPQGLAIHAARRPDRARCAHPCDAFFAARGAPNTR